MKIRIYLLTILIAAFFLAGVRHVSAQASSTVNATVKISICGNGIIEGGEDCEGPNLNSKTCSSLGHSGGSLKCDISCSYDATGCATASQASSNTNSSNSVDSQLSPTIPQAVTNRTIITQTPSDQNVLPDRVIKYDPNKDGKIEIFELHSFIAAWVDDWNSFLEGLSRDNNDNSKNCDIDNSGDCGLHDFSILLYYVNR
jgi:hypothetical protein